MKIVNRMINKLVRIVLHYPRKIHYRKFKSRLTNQSPTIIASDCFGGFVYHNLGLQFRSPTVNLMFAKEDFITFVQNLKEYLEADLVQVEDPSVHYPIGELEYNGKKVRLHFLHFDTFEIAKEKWLSRKSRVDYSNIYIIQLIAHATEQDIEMFEQLPYKNKMLVTGENPANSKCVVTHPIFQKENYRHGAILKYKTLFSMERHMDDIDYVGFLNRPNE